MANPSLSPQMARASYAALTPLKPKCAAVPSATAHAEADLEHQQVQREVGRPAVFAEFELPEIHAVAERR